MSALAADTNQTARQDRRIATALGLLLGAVYLTAGAYHFFAIDEIATFALTRSLLGHGGADVDILAWVEPIMRVFSVSATGVDGHTYAIKDIAPSILMMPLAGLGYLLGISPVRLVYLMPVMITALTAALLYLMARDQGYARRTALLTGLVYGLASMAFPYAKVIFTQSVAALGLLVALWGATRARRSGRIGPALLSGAGLGLAGLSAAPTWITGPVYLGWLLLPQTGDRKPSMRTALAWCAAAGIFAVGQGGYNIARFGAPLETGHHLIGATIDPMYAGLASWAQLISVPRGVIWFAPFVMLIPFALPAGRRRGQLPLQLACLAMTGLVVLIYGAYFNWSAGQSFGPRYLAMVMPALALAAAPLLDTFPSGMKPAPRILTGAVLAVSLLTELGASLLDYTRAEGHIYEVLGAFTPPKSFFDFSPALFNPADLIQVHLVTALRGGWWDVLWMSRGAPDWPLLAGCLALIGTGAACLVTVSRGVNDRAAKTWLAAQSILMVGLAAWAIGSYPRPAGYARAESAPLPGLDEAIRQLDAHALPGDGAIVTLYPEDNLSWVESPVPALPDIGLPLATRLRRTTIEILGRVPGWHGRVWVVSLETPAGDPNNGLEVWLSQHAFAGEAVTSGDFRLAPYSFGEGKLNLRQVDYSFGDGAIHLSGFASQAAGNGRINVWLRWTGAQNQADYTVFVHLLDAQGRLIAQHDGTPQAGYAPTSGWKAGTAIDDRHSLDLPAGLAPGVYTLSIGLYDSASGQPLLLDGGGRALTLTTITLGPNAK